MEDKKNTHWSEKDDNWLIENRHRGINYLAGELGRTRKAIKSRFTTLFNEGKIQQTIVVEKDSVESLMDNLILKQVQLVGSMEESNQVRQKNIDLLDWALHIIKSYDISPEDCALLGLVAFNKEYEIETEI